MFLLRCIVCGPPTGHACCVYLCPRERCVFFRVGAGLVEQSQHVIRPERVLCIRESRVTGGHLSRRTARGACSWASGILGRCLPSSAPALNLQAVSLCGPRGLGRRESLVTVDVRPFRVRALSGHHHRAQGTRSILLLRAWENLGREKFCHS